MTEPGTGASGTDPGNAAPPSDGAPPTNGSGGAPQSNWAAGLQDEGNRTLVELKGWSDKPLDAVLKSYSELEGKLGKSVIPPGENATQEEKDKFAKAIGRPESPDGYTFKLAPDIPAEFPYDPVAATTYKTWSHEYALSPWQAQGLHDRFVAKQAEMGKAAQATQQTKVAEAHTQIVQKWGPPDSAGHTRNVELASRTIRKLELADDLKSSGLLTAKGEITSPKLAFALARIGGEMFEEDRFHGGPQSVENPWVKGKENLTEQGRILRADPELAETLMRSAGLDPAKAVWKDPHRKK